jgi:RNA polymerase sigma factor (sigma-70 family)
MEQSWNRVRERGESKPLEGRARYFEQALWPHLRSAYNLARWLARNDQDAEDIVQEAFTKAFQAQERLRGGDPRVWLLAIVRNTTMNFLRRRKQGSAEAVEAAREPADRSPDPEARLIDQSRREQVRAAIDLLAPEFRETIILRELEELSYKEIAAVLNVPIGTVMSRLSRARDLLIEQLMKEGERQ